MKELIAYLQVHGWKEYPTYVAVQPERTHRLWCKRIATLNPCTSNEWNQLCLHYTELDVHGNISDSVTVDLRGEVEGTTWYTLEAYSMSPKHFIANADSIATKLSRAWEALHTEETL